MSDSKPGRVNRFHLLEPREPNNPSPEALASRVVEPAARDHFTPLTPSEPSPPIALPTAFSDRVATLAAELGDLLAVLDEPARRAVAATFAARVSDSLAQLDHAATFVLTARPRASRPNS